MTTGVTDQLYRARKRFRKSVYYFLVVAFISVACVSAAKKESVHYKILEGYFVSNEFVPFLPVDTVIRSSDQFHKIFGYATVMGRQPAAIDFENEVVLAIMPEASDQNPQIELISLLKRNEEILVRYKIILGQKQSYTVKPLLLISLPKKYSNKFRFIRQHQAVKNR